LLVGKFAEALNVLGKNEDFKIQSTFFGIALVDLGLLPTRYQYLNYLTHSRSSLPLTLSPDDLSYLLTHYTYDLQRSLYHLVYTLQLQQLYPTESICLLRALESDDLLLLALARYLIYGGSPDGRLYSLLLETDKTTSFLDFENNHGLTLRHILSQDDHMFTRLVEKVVEINEGEKRDRYMSVLMLDKINRREKVLEKLIRV
jgi:hypothetical protein